MSAWWLPLALVLVLAWAVTAQANVFGDGDSGNGDEDGRVAAPLGGTDYRQWAAAGGTVHCDGQLRGSATVVRSPVDPDQAIVVTAAHVLVDLKRQVPFRDCLFAHLGLAQVAGARYPLSPERRMAGPFDGSEDPAMADFGSQDWEFIAVDDPDGRLGALQARPWRVLSDDANDIFLLAWDAGAGRLAVSGPCRVRESGRDDLGGGAWPGQLLDDCDSGPGASGGGLLARTPDGVFLVGIRTGSHWDPGTFPPERFPAGPPDGSPWGVRSNTNFARAFDADLVDRLGRLLALPHTGPQTRLAP